MINEAKALNKALLDTEEAKEFFALKNEIAKDEYLTNLLKLIEEQKTKTNEALKANDIATYRKEKQYLDIINEEFLNYPLINNYLISKNNLFNLLEQVVNILSE